VEREYVVGPRRWWAGKAVLGDVTRGREPWLIVKLEVREESRVDVAVVDGVAVPYVVTDEQRRDDQQRDRRTSHPGHRTRPVEDERDHEQREHEHHRVPAQQTSQSREGE